MIASFDLRAVRKASSSHAALRACLQQLVGQPFLLLRFAYADEFTLHFGPARKYRSPKLAHLERGSYIIAARASSWFLNTRSPPAVIFGSEQALTLPARDRAELTPETLERSGRLRRGARITAIDAIRLGTRRLAYGFGLSLLLDDGSSLVIEPPPPNRASRTIRGIADWEVFTPHERYLRIGPGLQWSYLESRSPEITAR